MVVRDLHLVIQSAINDLRFHLEINGEWLNKRRGAIVLKFNDLFITLTYWIGDSTGGFGYFTRAFDSFELVYCDTWHRC